MAPSAHDHESLRERLEILLATYRASQRLGLTTVLSAADLLRRRAATLTELRELAATPGLDQTCFAACEEAIVEVTAG